MGHACCLRNQQGSVASNQVRLASHLLSDSSIESATGVPQSKVISRVSKGFGHGQSLGVVLTPCQECFCFLTSGFRGRSPETLPTVSSRRQPQPDHPNGRNRARTCDPLLV